MKPVYQTKVAASGGRNGKIKSEDGILEMNVEMPEVMGGKGGSTNPEQLFAAGYAACFDSALNFTALQKKQKIQSETEVEVGLSNSGEEGFFLSASIIVDIKGVDRKEAQELIDAAHEVCPYSKATRGNIEVSVNLK